MTDPEDLLRDALRKRADTTSYDATHVGLIADRAHRLRRRRRGTAAALAAAAVLVVVVPVAIVTQQGGDTLPEPAPYDVTTAPPTSPQESLSTSTPTSPPNLTQAPSQQAPSQQAPPARTGPPLIAYAEGDKIVDPDGGLFSLPRGLGVSAFARQQGGYLVADTRYFEGSVGLTRYDESGSALESWSGNGLAAGDGDSAAWSSFSPPESGYDVPTLIHLDEVTQQVEQVGPAVVAVLSGEVVFNGGGVEPRAWITDLVNAPRPITPLREAADAAGGLVAGQIDDQVTAVVDLATGEELWRRSSTYAIGLSPDGRYLHVARDGLGRQDEVLDARTGAVVTEVPGTGLSGLPGLHDLAWEDEQHLLGVLDGDILRVALDGSTAVAQHIGRRPIGAVVFAAQP